MDLEALSLTELKSLRKRVDVAIAGFENRKKKEAADMLAEKARELGFSLNELADIAGVKKRKPVAPKYANPADATQTWTGRGRTPLWVRAALEAGKTMDDLAI